MWLDQIAYGIPYFLGMNQLQQLFQDHLLSTIQGLLSWLADVYVL
jgi:hypothetical protein